MKIVNGIYIDIENSDLTNLNILFGARGPGKTFSILKHRIEDSVADETEQSKFIWLRDSETVIRKIAAGNSLTAPIEAKTPNFPHVEIIKTGGETYKFILDPKTDNYRELGYLMALSTFHNARGLSYEDVIDITWDEFIPEEGTIVKKHQGTIFLNAYESINRNRELEEPPRPPVRITFLSNSEDLYSDVLEDLGVSYIIEHMSITGEKTYRDEDIWIEMIEAEEFKKKKAETFIYRINKNDKFKNMALDNKFNNNLALIKPDAKLKKATGLFTIANRYTLLQLADGSLYYKLGVWKGLQNYDMDNDQEAILYRLLFNDKLRLQYIAGNMFFDSIYTQRAILEYSKI